MRTDLERHAGGHLSRAVDLGRAIGGTRRLGIAERTGRGFPTAVFAGLGDEPVSDELAAELQEVLDTSANGHGLTATLITPQGTWSGATGFAAGDRAMVPNDQMSIASITKTLVAAQVMQLVEAGELGLDDLAADRLPPDLEFDTNGATIDDLLSMRSGIPEYMDDEGTPGEPVDRPVARLDDRREACNRRTRTWPGRSERGSTSAPTTCCSA